jgi:hypothetical protein
MFFVCSPLWFDALGFAPHARGVFLSRCFPPLTGVLLSSSVAKKKVSKEEGDPGSVPGFAGFPALLGLRGGCATRG